MEYPGVRKKGCSFNMTHCGASSCSAYKRIWDEELVTLASDSDLDSIAEGKENTYSTISYGCQISGTAQHFAYSHCSHCLSHIPLYLKVAVHWGKLRSKSCSVYRKLHQIWMLAFKLTMETGCRVSLWSLKTHWDKKYHFDLIRKDISCL